jgi:ABC-type multidrug transport system ATPase subunit
VSAQSIALQATDVRKRYGSNHALRGVTLSLMAGGFHVLVGRNGAGKSTLMRILARRETADSGTAFLLSRSIDEDRAEHGRDVEFVSEAVDYGVPLTMQRFFARFAEIRPGWQLAPFEASMRTLGVDLDKSFSALSRGQRMQVACAAALASKPRFLLLDEVTSVLDARARPYFVDAFADLCREGGTVLMATNIVSEVRDVADRLLFLEEGVVSMDVTVPELSERFVRLVQVSGQDHPIFASRACVRIGKGDDGRPHWLCPRDEVTAKRVPESLFDPRKVTPEEAFIYFSTRAA